MQSSTKINGKIVTPNIRLNQDGIGELTDVGNGLSRNGSTVLFGGTLTQDTKLTLDKYSLSIFNPFNNPVSIYGGIVGGFPSLNWYSAGVMSGVYNLYGSDSGRHIYAATNQTQAQQPTFQLPSDQLEGYIFHVHNVQGNKFTLLANSSIYLNTNYSILYQGKAYSGIYGASGDDHLTILCLNNWWYISNIRGDWRNLDNGQPIGQ
jgi:hypothetical protein